MIPRDEHLLHKAHHTRTQYLSHIYGRGALSETVNRLDRLLETLRGEFDTIAFMGHSGAAVGFPLGAMGWPITCVRKRGEQSHHIAAQGMCPVEGTVGDGLRALLIDDQVGTGATVDRIVYELGQLNMVCAGVVVYQFSLFSSARSHLDGRGLRYWECTKGGLFT